MGKGIDHNRFFGGHYDTVKQSKILTDYQESKEVLLPFEELRKRYTARLRLDILFHGKVVLTDAMVYDGTYFHSLIMKEPSFITFLNTQLENDAPLIEIKRRPKGLLGFIYRGTYFSSFMGTSQQRKEVNNTTLEVVKRRLEMGKDDFSSVDDAFTEFYNSCDISLQNAFQKMSETMVKLDRDIPERVFVPWEENWIKKLRKAQEEFPYDFQIPAERDTPTAEILRGMKREYYGEFNRANLWQIAWGDQYPNSTNIPIYNAWVHALQVYNLALAYQHKCTNLDEGEKLSNPHHSDYLKKKIIDLDPGFITAIAEEDWNEFLKRLSKEPIQKPFLQWHDALADVKSPPDGLEKELFLFTKINALVIAIMKSYERSYSPADTKDILLGAGSLLDKQMVPGLIIGAIVLSFELGKKMIDYYNLIRIGLENYD